MRVLIAQEATSGTLLRKTAESAGHECLEVGSKAEVLDLLDQFQPDVLFTEWELPDVAGDDFADQVKAVELERPVYIIAVTPDDEAVYLAALEDGADDYTVMPVSAGAVKARLRVATRFAGLARLIFEKQLEIERLNGELHGEGQRDPLTRIGNRSRMDEDLAALSDRAIRYGHAFSIGICDVDHFHKYNEICGRSAGDNALRAIARSLASFGRLGDTAYRLSGEEFVVVLPEAKLSDATRAMDRRRKAIEGLQIPHPGGGPDSTLTISIGVAAFDPAIRRPLETLLDRAHKALASAKEAGRNAVRCFEPDEEPAVSGRESGSP